MVIVLSSKITDLQHQVFDHDWFSQLVEILHLLQGSKT